MKSFLTALTGFVVSLLLGCDRPANGAAVPGSSGVLQASDGNFVIAGSVLENTDVSTITRGNGHFGILASDEGAIVQAVFISPDGANAYIHEDLPLAEPTDMEIDFEASTFMDEWFYVTGSHGAAKKKGTYDEPRARIFRFRLTEDSRGVSDLQVATLAPLLAADPTLGPYHKMPLQQRGVNVEGLAGRDGHLYIGLRNPNLDGDSFVLRVAADALFSDEEPAHELLRVHLGQGLGIRAMDPVRDGFLLIAGNAGSEASNAHPRTVDYIEDRASALFLWRPDRSESIRLGFFPQLEGAKEEGILVLSEEPGALAEVVVLYDGIADGGARRFLVDIPE